MSRKKRKIGLDDILKDQGAGGIEGLGTMEPEFKPEFRLDEKKGVYFLPVDKDKDGNTKPEEWICSPLKILTLTRDGSSENWGYVVSLKDRDGKEKLWSLPSEMLAGDCLRLRETLMSKGLLITPNAHLRQKLPSYIQFAKPEYKQRAICTDRTGWYGGKLFVLPDQTIGDQTGE